MEAVRLPAEYTTTRDNVAHALRLTTKVWRGMGRKEVSNSAGVGAAGQSRDFFLESRLQYTRRGTMAAAGQTLLAAPSRTGRAGPSGPGFDGSSWGGGGH